MGVLLTADPPIAGSGYDRWIAYRSASKTGSYGAINGTTGQATSDMSYYDEGGTSTHWYKVAYYNSSTAITSQQSDPMQGQSTSYTSVRKVERFMMLPTISDSTNPSIQEIMDLINRVEDRLDYRTGHAWRNRYSGTVSGQDQTADYEYHDLDLNYEATVGTPVYLNHRKVKALSAASGDALEIWNGNSYDDYLATKTENRANDFWLDYDRGILYVKTWYLRGPQRVRIKYRYGEDYVNKMVEDIATKMVAIDILSGMQGRQVIAVEGAVNSLTHASRIKLWQDQIEADLNGLKEFQIPSITL